MVSAGWLVVLLAASVSAQVPGNLRCEWQTEPIAIQTLTPSFSWIIRAVPEEKRGIRQTAYRIIVATSRRSIGLHVADVWDSGKVDSSNTLQIGYSGKELTSGTTYYWAVQSWDQSGALHWSTGSEFQTGLLYQKDWSATWITAAVSPESEPSLPLLRREFRISKTVKRAMVYISGLGQYEFHLNGEKVGDAVLSPGWTNYRKTVLYNSFDVTGALHKGENVFGVSLGNGMYNVERARSRYSKFTGSFGPPKLLFQAQITFTDGSTLRVISDHSWRTNPGPVVFSSIYGGEDYDARLEQPGWDGPGFKEKEWLEAQETEGPGGRLISEPGPPIKVSERYKPVSVTRPQPGIEVYDLGRNFSGWPEVSVRGPRGSSIKLVPGELLDREGFASQRSSGGPQWFSYTLKGQGVESWHPRFSYWGFRYLQIERQPDAGVNPEVLSVEGQVIHAAATPVGKFESSDDLLNRIHRLIDAAVESNLQSILTDCPHREKLGWLEESYLMGSALMYNFDLAALYNKIAIDISDAQDPDGLVPDIAPEYVVFEGGFRDSPEWGSAAILEPWLAYQTYGDKVILASHYDVMRRYASYLASKTEGKIIAYGLGDWYDIGPGNPGVSKLTSLGVTATATYYKDLTTLSSIAKVLGRPEDESAFETKASEVRLAFNSHFYNSETHIYDHSSQTAYAMALATGLTPDEDRPFVLRKLVQDIRAHNNHVTAGDVGFHYVVKALMNNGRSDVLYDMLSRTDAPSYGYQLKAGATTLTEAWDTDPHSSQNHFMLGDAEEWFYRALAGIDLDLSRPEAERLIIRPSPVGNLTYAGAAYESVMGTIASKWTKQNGTLTFTIDVPANLTAIIELPTGNASVDNSEGVRLKGSADGISTYRVLSGRYVFHSQH